MRGRSWATKQIFVNTREPSLLLITLMASREITTVTSVSQRTAIPSRNFTHKNHQHSSCSSTIPFADERIFSILKNSRCRATHRDVPWKCCSSLKSLNLWALSAYGWTESTRRLQEWRGLVWALSLIAGCPFSFLSCRLDCFDFTKSLINPFWCELFHSTANKLVHNDYFLIFTYFYRFPIPNIELFSFSLHFS